MADDCCPVLTEWQTHVLNSRMPLLRRRAAAQLTTANPAMVFDDALCIEILKEKKAIVVCGCGTPAYYGERGPEPSAQTNTLLNATNQRTVRRAETGVNQPTRPDSSNPTLDRSNIGNGQAIGGRQTGLGKDDPSSTSLPSSQVPSTQANVNGQPRVSAATGAASDTTQPPSGKQQTGLSTTTSTVSDATQPLGGKQQPGLSTTTSTASGITQPLGGKQQPSSSTVDQHLAAFMSGLIGNGQPGSSTSTASGTTQPPGGKQQPSSSTSTASGTTQPPGGKQQPSVDPTVAFLTERLEANDQAKSRSDKALLALHKRAVSLQMTVVTDNPNALRPHHHKLSGPYFEESRSEILVYDVLEALSKADWTQPGGKGRWVLPLSTAVACFMTASNKSPGVAVQLMAEGANKFTTGWYGHGDALYLSDVIKTLLGPKNVTIANNLMKMN